MNTIGNEDPIQ